MSSDVLTGKVANIQQPSFLMETIDIPIANSSQVIEVPLSELPDSCDDICEVLDSEEAPIELYLRFAKVYFLKNNFSSYKTLLEMALLKKDHVKNQKSYIALLDHLGSLYIRSAISETSNKKRYVEFLEDATSKFNEADRLDSRDELTVLGKGILFMIKRNFDSAVYHFNLLLERDNLNLVALNALATISFERKEYKDALSYFRRIVKNFSFVPFFVTLGISLCLFYLERYDESEFAFKATLELNSSCVEAYIHLSHLEKEKGAMENIKNSIEYVKRGLKIDPKNPVLLYELASHFFYLKDFFRCHSICYEAFSIAQTDKCKARCCFLLARNFHSNDNFDEAFRYYLQAAKLDTTLIAAQVGLAQCHIQRGENGPAVEVLELVLDAEPFQYEALKMISVIVYNNQKETAKHLKWIQKLVQSYPNDIEGLVMYASTLEHLQPAHSLDIYMKCIEILKCSQIAVPAEIWNNVAVLYARTNLFTDALEIFQSHVDMTACISTEMSLCMRFNNAFLLEKNERTDEAISLYTGLVKEYSSFTDALLRLAWIAMSTKNFALAEEYLKEASMIDPKNLQVWYHYAYLYHTNKSSANSQERKAYERILSTISKHDLISLISIGNIYYRSSRKAPSRKAYDSELGKAYDFYNKALHLEPHSTYAANGLAIYLQQKGCIEEAKEIFAQLKQNEVDFPDCWINLAHIHLESNQYYAALNLYETAQKRFYQERDPIIFMFMAKCLYCLGREESNFVHLERAISCLEKASQLETSDSLISYNLAMCLQEVASLKLSQEIGKISSQDLQHSAVQVQSAIDIFSQLATLKDVTSKESKIYSNELLKTRLSSCIKLKEDAINMQRKQAEQILLRQERLQQLKEMRRIQQEKLIKGTRFNENYLEEKKSFVEVNDKKGQEKEIVEEKQEKEIVEEEQEEEIVEEKQKREAGERKRNETLIEKQNGVIIDDSDEVGNGDSLMNVDDLFEE